MQFKIGDKVDYKPKQLADLSFFLPGVVKDIKDNQISLEFTMEGKPYLEKSDFSSENLRECGKILLTRTDC